MNDIILCGKTGIKLEEVQTLLKSMRSINAIIMSANETIAKKEQNENTIIVYINLKFEETIDAVLNSENENLTNIQKEERYRIFTNEVYDYRLMPFIADVNVRINKDTPVNEIVYKIWEGLRDKI